MKIGVISDTHLGGVTKELMDIFDRHLKDKDVVIHAGDVVSPEVIRFLSQKTFHGVQGNMDPPEVKELLPDRVTVELAGFTIGIIHGWGAAAGLEERILPMFQGVDVLIYGHTHRPLNEVDDGVRLFNPGTATGYSASGNHSMGILEIDDTIRADIIRL
ncbi:MAG: metallophosphoesterase family protein [Deltaproteobacteria bacterium]|nr:metallophosphoesterase family protein [Deltaproteobacteria bacterium]